MDDISMCQKIKKTANPYSYDVLKKKQTHKARDSKQLDDCFVHNVENEMYIIIWKFMERIILPTLIKGFVRQLF